MGRLYLGKVGTGVLKVITLGGCGVWWLTDLILVLVGTTKDQNGYALAGYEEHKRVAWIVTAVLWRCRSSSGRPTTPRGATSSTSAPTAREW